VNGAKVLLPVLGRAPHKKEWLYIRVSSMGNGSYLRIDGPSESVLPFTLSMSLKLLSSCPGQCP